MINVLSQSLFVDGEMLGTECANMPYYERQVGDQCGVHVLNGIVQHCCYTKEDLDEISREISEIDVEFNHGVGGFWSYDVLSLALMKRHNVRMRFFRETGLGHVRENPDCAMGYIIHKTKGNRQDHWYALRKIGQVWWNLDSMRGQAVPFDDINSLVWALDNTYEDGDAHGNRNMVIVIENCFNEVDEVIERGSEANEFRNVIVPTLAVMMEINGRLKICGDNPMKQSGIGDVTIVNESKKPDSKKPESKKPDLKKTHSKMPEEKKPEEKKPEEKKPEEKKGEEKKGEEKKGEEKKGEEKKEGQKKPDSKKPDSKKPDSKKSDSKKSDSKKSDSKKPDSKTTDSKKPDSKKPDSKKVNSKKPDCKKQDSKKQDWKKRDSKEAELSLSNGEKEVNFVFIWEKCADRGKVDG